MTGQLEQFLRGVPTSGRWVPIMAINSQGEVVNIGEALRESLKLMGPGELRYVELSNPHRPGPTPMQLLNQGYRRR